MKNSITALITLTIALSCANGAAAAPLLSLDGHVALADGAPASGVTVKLEVDLDRNGKFAKFETLSAKVAEDGSYALSYELDPSKVDLEFISFVAALVADFNARGLDALLDGGPLPVFLSFERKGYSTLTKRLSSLLSNPKLDVVLAPLSQINCQQDSCMTPDGAVRLQGFPGGTGIARAFAQAYDPTLNTEQFPGTFSDADDHLLISSGFAEINAFDSKDRPITTLSSPVSARFEMNRASWSTLPDLVPDSGEIELPMYSFDRATEDWVREGDGVLQRQDGSPVPESAVESIRDGSFDGPVYVAFTTKHFSTFNCDEPRQARACVKGRLVDDSGAALEAITVSLEGQSYTGSAGSMLTGADGYFAGDVLRSEALGQDLDRNGKQGEVFQARVRASGELGVFTGSAFDTPLTEGSVKVGAGSRSACKPQACECTDIGDVSVKFEKPRLCEAQVHVTFSGEDVAGSEGPLAPGDAVASAHVRAQLVGGLGVSQAAVRALCADKDCGFGSTDASGMATLTIPVLGDQPRVEIHAALDDASQHYSGSVAIDGCSRGVAALEAVTQLEVSHASLDGLAAFIASLGPKRTTSADGGMSGPQSPFRCGCRIAGADGRRARWPSVAWLAVGLALYVRRRRRR